MMRYDGLSLLYTLGAITIAYCAVSVYVSELRARRERRRYETLRRLYRYRVADAGRELREVGR